MTEVLTSNPNKWFQEIVELGDTCVAQGDYQNDTRKFREALALMPDDEKLETVMLQHIWGKSLGTKRKKVRKDMQCKWCWLQMDHCLCSSLPISQYPLKRTKIIMLLHYKEYRRASNTAKIIMHTLPTQPIYLYAYKKHMQELENELAKTKKAFVLFPSDRAVTFQQHFAEFQPNEIQSENALLGSEEDPLTIVVVDGTWRDARKIYSSCEFLQRIPALRLHQDSVDNHKPMFVARQKSDVLERISTLEAVSLILKEVAQLHNEVESSPEIISSNMLLYSMNLVMQKLQLQSGIK